MAVMIGYILKLIERLLLVPNVRFAGLRQPDRFMRYPRMHESRSAIRDTPGTVALYRILPPTL